MLCYNHNKFYEGSENMQTTKKQKFIGYKTLVDPKQAKATQCK